MTDTGSCPHDHREDNYAPGTVYQVQIILPNGIIFRSTPMNGEEANDTMLLIDAALAEFKGRGVGSTKIDEMRAKQLLAQDADLLRDNAKNIDTHLVPGHTGFAINALNLLEAADRFAEQAAAITIAN
jgi:hypothetical protein